MHSLLNTNHANENLYAEINATFYVIISHLFNDSNVHLNRKLV